MAKEKKKVPNLRFKGFTNDWEQRKLGELYSYHNGKAHEQNQRSSGKYELINLNSISVDGTLKSSGRYINHADEILRQNDLVMILSDIAHGTLLGRVAIIPQDNKYVLNQRVALLRPISKSENSNFMAPLINNNQRYFHKMGIGTSQLNISKSTVIESLWQIPKIKEQSVIGNFLQNIDHIIALQQRKLELLKEIKKGLLQKMFAEKNSKQPVLRFKGFHDDWEQRKLGDVAQIETGKLDANAMVEGGKYDFYTSGIKKYHIDIPAFEGPAITIAGNGATVGYMHLADGMFNAYQRTYVLTKFIETDRRFLFNEIGNNLPRKIQQESRAGNIPYIVMDMLTGLKISLPSFAEQEKIGKYFADLDSLIALHQRKQNHFKLLKKSLLQQMFM